MDGVTTGGCKRIWRLGGSVRMAEGSGGERHGDSDNSHLLATAEAATNISIIQKRHLSIDSKHYSVSFG